ncbi:MAG: EAL domain-containing protein [Aulosira sp. ZfuVER01]|nr:EAL domain-containing protein [Aulosira sp. ZfuVER01]MDZ8001581.1 EAL domain-containing protein [Aulosira sp. DedVER01a]MDZ8051551.1 EAL domain-containing protein [Aulosira sp. ZfuCHP01]
MVFTQRYVYKNQDRLNNLNKNRAPRIQECNAECKNLSRMLLAEVETCKQSKLDCQELLSSFAELSPFPVAIVCLESNQILFKNDILEPFFGVESADSLNKITSDFCANPAVWTQLISQLQLANAVKNFAVQLKKFNGDTFATQISAKVVNYEGKLAALLIFTGMSSQTPAIALSQVETRLHLMERAIASSSNGIILTDPNQPDNPIIYVNPAFEAITGYSASEVIGRNCRFLQGTDREQTALSELRTAIQEQRECHVILRNYRKDGTPFWHELYVAPVFDAFGSLTHFIGVQTDITEHLQALETLRQREEQYRRIVETATEGIWVLDENNQTSFVNKQMATMLGYSADEMQGATLFSFMDAEGIEIANTYLERRHQGINEKHDFKFRCKDGSDLWAIVSCAPMFDEQGNYTGVLGMITDISDVYDELRLRKRAEAELQESKQRLDGILCSLEDVVWSISADTFETLYLNPAVLKIYGRPESEFFDNLNLWFEVIHPEDQPQVHAAIQPLLVTGYQELEYRIIRPDGQVRWLLNRSHLIYDTNDQPVRIEGIATDITERKQMEEKLVRHAFYDALTGLPNRVLFMDKLGQAIERVKSNPDDLFAVLFVDLDRFKVVNDSLGHLVGDRLLVAFAQRLQSCLQPDDIVARLGGDEFTILLSHIKSIDDATRIAEQIHQVLKLPFNLQGYEVFTTASIGIALSTTAYNQPADLLRDADTALYHAKEQGKAWHIVFDTTMYDRAVALLQLETDLRWAIERQELQVFYQPIVSVATGEITGFEALVRWQHPERGLISPNEFIPVAEETGLIVTIGQWVLRESCQQLWQWQLQFPAMRPLTINVNLSGKQFSQPYLVEQIDQILQETGLDPSSLKLEITESAIITSPEKAATVLKKLKAFGMQLCIDDFGTGYSSLGYLHHFPIDVLKIDRSFVNQIDRDGEQLAIIRAIVTLAHNLGMSVVAEGVETMNQLLQLRLLECDQAQGYLFSRPLDREQTSLFLASKL